MNGLKRVYKVLFIRYFVLFLLASLFFFTACKVRINNSIHIRSGSKIRGSQNTINGSIYIDNDCYVKGDCRSVNGVIEVGENSKVKKLQTVNGGITLGPGVMVHGDVASVNGSVKCNSGTVIEGDVSSVNGSVLLNHTSVADDVNTYNGNVLLENKSVVEDNIVVKDAKGRNRRDKPLIIKIMGDSVVEGDIIVRDEDVKVEVYLIDGGHVKGRIRNAQVIKQ